MESLKELLETPWSSASVSVAGLVGIAVAVIAASYFYELSFSNKKCSSSTTTTTSKSKQKQRRPVCPFSAETEFIVEIADHAPPAPLELLESWTDPSSPDYGKPLAARWLQAGISGQDTPGMVRAGLKRLRDSKYFLVEEPSRMQEELLMKQSALDNPERYPRLFVAEPDSLAAQQEVLDLFLSYLPRRYPHLYQYNPHDNTIYVQPIDTTFSITDFHDRPLELCERIVQEDLILMRPPRETDVDNHNQQYVLAAAGVVFSFGALPEKLGQPMSFIHAPVPAYETQLRKTLDLTFAKLLKVPEPLWRNNWSIDPCGLLDQRPDSHGSLDLHHNRTFSNVTVDDVKAKFLAVEYQTIRRLPTSGYLLFTVKVLTDPMHSLEQIPEAAQCLAHSIRGMSSAMRQYKGIQDDATAEVVLEYLDSIVAKQTTNQQS